MRYQQEPGDSPGLPLGHFLRPHVVHKEPSVAFPPLEPTPHPWELLPEGTRTVPFPPQTRSPGRGGTGG